MGWKKPRAAARACSTGDTVRAGPCLARGKTVEALARDKRTQVSNALGEHLGVDRVGEQAVVDDGRHAGVVGGEPDRASRARPHDEGRGARLELSISALLERRDVEQVPEAGLAAARAGPHRDLRHEHGELGREARGLALQHGRRLEPEPHPDVVLRPSPTGSAGSSPLRRRTAGEPYAPAATTTVRARTSPSSVASPTARPASTTTRSTSALARIVRFVRDRAGSRYANPAFQRVVPRTFAVWTIASSPAASANARCQGDTSSPANGRGAKTASALSRNCATSAWLQPGPHAS